MRQLLEMLDRVAELLEGDGIYANKHIGVSLPDPKDDLQIELMHPDEFRHMVSQGALAFTVKYMMPKADAEPGAKIFEPKQASKWRGRAIPKGVKPPRDAPMSPVAFTLAIATTFTDAADTKAAAKQARKVADYYTAFHGIGEVTQTKSGKTKTKWQGQKGDTKMQVVVEPIRGL